MSKNKVDTKRANKILKAYVDLRRSLKREVKMSDLGAIGYTKDSIKHYYSSLSNLDAKARAKYPKYFHDVAVDSLYSPVAIKKAITDIASHKRFFVTTAVTGCKVDDKFLDSIKAYCNSQNAKLLVLLSSDPAGIAGFSVDKKLANETIIFEEVSLNSNIFLSTIKTSAKQIDPITNLQRIGQREGTFVFASPKQRLKMVAVANTKLPHALMTTGAITQPNYKTDSYMSERTAVLAHHDHIMGGLIIEIENNEIYYYRQVQANKDGSFVDLGVKYKPNGQTEVYNPKVLVMGDLHSGETDPSVMKCTFEMIKQFQPQAVVLHDAFNGLSINHHEEGNQIMKAIRASQNQLSLENEFKGLATDIDSLAEEVDEIIITKGNHDEFLSKHYLAKGKYVEDPQNHRISLDLAAAMIDGHDPLKFGVEQFGKLKNKSKVKWLQRDDDYKVSGIQLGSHGDKGSNGSKGSLASMENAYNNSVTGHSHQPAILRGAWSVGTSTYLKLSYNEGPSSWLNTHCLVYENGARQLINIVNAKWKL